MTGRGYGAEQLGMRAVGRLMPDAGLVGDVEQCAPYLTPIGMSLESGCSGSRCEGEDHFGTTMHGCSIWARALSVADVC